MRLSDERGFVLVTMCLVVVLAVSLGGAMLSQAVAEVWASQRSQAGMQAFYLSESATDRALKWLRGQPFPPGGTAPFVLFGGWQNLGADGSYMVVVDPDDNNPASFIKRYTVQGFGAVGPLATPMATRQINLLVQAEHFSRYAYFTDNEKSPSGSTVWFINGDHIEGPTHTNGQFSMRGRPRFDGPVSSVSNSLNLWGGGPPATDPVFNGGLQLGVPLRAFPAVYPNSVVNAANNGGLVLNGNTDVTLLSSGMMQVTNAGAGWSNQMVPLPANGVLYVNGGDVKLQGSLRGQLTIGTSGDVQILNSVTYANDPRVTPSSQDILGIVAGNNVVISQSAPSDVEIDAAVMALNTSFIVQNWAVGPPKGTLTVLGGIIQQKRGPVGTFSSSTGLRLSGYAKDYHYDRRMVSMVPPFFPTTGEYSLLGWDDPVI